MLECVLGQLRSEELKLKTELILLGERQGTLRPSIDALYLYVTLVSLSVFHKSNAFTISYMFENDLLAADWQQHKHQAYEMICAYLKPSTD